MDGIAEPHLPVCPGRSCGARQRTLRQVLEYSPQSTIRDCARRPCVFRTSRLCRAAGKTVFLLPAVLFSVAGGFFSSVGRVGGLSFCPHRSPFRRKSSAAGAVFPGVLEFSYKKQSGFFRRLKNMFYSSFLGCLEKFSYLYRTFPPEKSCRKIWWEP